MHKRRKTSILAGIIMFAMLVSAVTIFPPALISSVDEPGFETADFVSKTILFDESHTANGSSLYIPSNASLLSAMLNENGYSSDTNFDQSLDSGVLSGYDILVIFFPRISLTAGEISAIHTFVDNGGGLLLVGVDGQNAYNYNSSLLNPISSTFGITFNNDMLDVAVTTFPVHNVTYGVTSFWTRSGSFLRGCSLDVTGSALSVITYGSDNLTAVAEYGLGRVVCVGAPGPFFAYHIEGGGHGPSHYQFSLNVIDWLSNNPKRDVVIPTISKITVGTGPSLSPAELDEYTLFIGQYHDHTTHSDGEHEPFEMLDVALEQGLDFYVNTDHSHVTPTYPEGITGALAMKAIALEGNLDITVVVGAELSSVDHTTAFPLTDNIWTNNQQTAIDEAHGQGAFVTFCHPTINPTYVDTYQMFDEYGFDAIEVDNSNFFEGGGEDGFSRRFMGANDWHSMHAVGRVLTGVFVRNPTGPDGRISDADLVDALMNRRNLILDPVNDFVYGEEVWVNRLFDIWDEANATLISAKAAVQAYKDAGQDVGLSEIYIENAQTALDYWNPSRALRLANNATSAVALGIDLNVDTPEVLSPASDLTVNVTLTNNHTYAVSVNASVYISQVVSVTPDWVILDAAAESTTKETLSVTIPYYGLGLLYLNLHSFSTAEYLMPVIARSTGIINNVSHSVREVDSQYEIDVSFWVGRDYIIQLESVSLLYDDGSGETSRGMAQGWNSYERTLGPFDPGETITYHIRITTTRGIVIDLGTHTIELPGVTTTTTRTTETTTSTTTTTTETPPPPPPPIEPMMLLIIVGGVGVVVIVLLILFRRK